MNHTWLLTTEVYNTIVKGEKRCIYYRADTVVPVSVGNVIVVRDESDPARGYRLEACFVEYIHLPHYPDLGLVSFVKLGEANPHP